MEVRIDPMLILQCSLDAEDEDTPSDSDSPTQRDDLSENENFEKYRKPYLCSFCPKSFASELALQNHSWNHSTITKKILNSHDNFPESVFHEETPDDEKETEDNDNASNHNDEDNDDDYRNSRFSCPICSKDISTKGNLKVHLETHRPKGKYGCDICGRM